MSGNPVLDRALAYARHGWSVFPCQTNSKIPATTHGFRDASTDPGQITEWFGGTRIWNVAIATGAPGPDVLDVDQHGQDGDGYAAFTQLRKAGLLAGASAHIQTPSGGLHAYFAGSDQRSGHLPAHHLDFRSAGGYVLAPPSVIDGRPYRLTQRLDGCGGLDWGAATRLLQPDRQPQPSPPGPAPSADLDRLAGWVAVQPEGNRNSGLYWAANRAFEADPVADLSPLAAAARQAGLTDLEITRTLNSARHTTTRQPNPQAEAT